MTELASSEQEKKLVKIPSAISVHEFADRLDVPATRVIGELMKNGVMATINETIDFETASIIGEDLGATIELEVVSDQRPARSAEIESAELVERPPVIAVMGHVDHGKTSLLDAFRDTDVAAGESGGITQHIGAYQVERKGRIMTFLDTPGHEAFSAIRAHGVKLTDVVVIVVAADDGVKPQTKEAVRMALEAEVGVVVAINKIDKTGVDTAKVKQQLSEIGIVPDDWGGDTPCVEVSAKARTNLDALLDMILLVSDIKKPTARVIGPADGIIIESHMEQGRGAMVTGLIEAGTLHAGDHVVAGTSYGKIRSLEDYRGKRLKSALPGTPVLISGFKTIPRFGDWFEVVESEKKAREWAASQARSSSIKSIVKPKSINAQDLVRAVNEGQVKELNVLIKADAQGSLESIAQSLEAIGNDEVRVKIVSSGIGDISENDINTAAAGTAMVLGFHVGIASSVNQLAKRNSVNFKLYTVIYELLDDIREWLTSLLEPETVETQTGELEVLGVFKVSRDQVICGGKVIKGQIDAGSLVHIKRGKEDIGAVELLALQKGQTAVETVMTEEECGMAISRDVVPEVGDHFIFFKRETKERSL
ncbi:translation initiation factor IF-2 [Candidatus Saccharibacteria bacterium]|nr:translation initiation factor IF-2 [Candidatus Saccharibacteria bacterium]